MEASKACFALLREVEGFSPTVYKDTGGVETIGFGHVMLSGDRMTLRPPITRDIGDLLLQQDVKIAEKHINKNVVVALEQCEHDALASFVFNVGGRPFVRSTLLRLLNGGDKEGAADEFKRWVFDNGKRIQGLANRRMKEEALFRGQIWQEV